MQWNNFRQKWKNKLLQSLQFKWNYKMHLFQTGSCKAKDRTPRWACFKGKFRSAGTVSVVMLGPITSRWLQLMWHDCIKHGCITLPHSDLLYKAGTESGPPLPDWKYRVHPSDRRSQSERKKRKAEKDNKMKEGINMRGKVTHKTWRSLPDL